MIWFIMNVVLAAFSAWMSLRRHRFHERFYAFLSGMAASSALWHLFFLLGYFVPV